MDRQATQLQVTMDDLLRMIGQLHVENTLLRARLAQATVGSTGPEQSAASKPPSSGEV